MNARQCSMMRPALLACAAVAAASLLAACASQVMKSYIGAPISSVMLDYGPPDNIYDIGPGERAFQWRKEKTQVVAGRSTGEIRETRRGERYDVTETPGYVERRECFYTFFTRASGPEWYVTSFRQPPLECE